MLFYPTKESNLQFVVVFPIIQTNIPKIRFFDSFWLTLYGILSYKVSNLWLLVLLTFLDTKMPELVFYHTSISNLSRSLSQMTKIRFWAILLLRLMVFFQRNACSLWFSAFFCAKMPKKSIFGIFFFFGLFIRHGILLHLDIKSIKSAVIHGFYIP